MIKIFTKEDWIPPFADKAGLRARARRSSWSRRCCPSPSSRSRPGIGRGRPEHRAAVLPGHVVAGGLQRRAGGLGLEQQVLAARRPAGGGADAELRGLHGPVADGRGHAGRLVQPAATSSRPSSGLWFVHPAVRRASSIFLIAGLAETRRLPFDLPEAESELVAGYHTEYSGMKFGMFFVGEYLGITLISALIVDAVLRRLAGPGAAAARLVPPQDVRCSSACSSCCAASLPRPRYDQLMAFGWKVHAAAGAAEPAGDRRRRAGDRRVGGRPCCSILTGIWLVFLHAFRRRVTVQYPEEKPLPAAALARADRPDARPRRRRALRGLLPLRRRLPGGLHRAPGDRGRARPALPGVLPHQLLALHLLRLLRGGLPDLRHPAHARLRDERVQRARTWSTRRRTC